MIFLKTFTIFDSYRADNSELFSLIAPGLSLIIPGFKPMRLQGYQLGLLPVARLHLLS